jgi:hypothetical protein
MCGIGDVIPSLILGRPVLNDGTLTLKRQFFDRTGDGWKLGSTGTQSEPVQSIDLANGERCLPSGQDPTLTVEGKRAGYSCGSAEIVLLGDPTITIAQLMKPFPEFTTVSLYRNNVGTSFYQGITARVEHRLSHGLSYLVSYTRSVLKDEASSVFDASILTAPIANFQTADSFDRARERDYSTGDIPHVCVASGVWTFHDWTLSGILTLQSGAPVAVTQATNFNAFAGFGIQRPNVVGTPELPADQRTPDHWFNTEAFAIAPMFTLGNASRNPIRGPAYRDLDLAVSRRIRLAGGTSLELRAEVFNALNTPALGAPNAVAGTPNFGTVTTAGDPRVGQFAVKLLF